jgi:hypothetical protein
MIELAKSYGISRQGLYVAMGSNALTRSDLLNPDYVFQRLLDLGRLSPLRTRLSNPATRQTIKKHITQKS